MLQGLLSFLPEMDEHKRNAMLAAAAAMLQSRGNTAQGIGAGVQSGLLGYQTSKGLGDRRAEEAQQRQARELMMEQQRRQMADQANIAQVYGRNSMPGNLAPNDDEGNPMPAAPQGLNLEGLKSGLLGAGPAGIREYAAIQSVMPKPPEPFKLNKNERLLEPGTNRELVPAAPEKTPDWLDPRYIEAQIKMRRASQPNVNVNLPAPEKAILKADSDRLDEYSASAASARKFAQTSRVINNILKNSGGGGLVKLGTETARFLGIQGGEVAANDLAESLNTRLATEVRMPGSGSTSNIEFEAYRQAGPSLRNSPEGREMMAQGAMKFAERQAKLADHARVLIRQGKYSDSAMQEYDEKLGSVLGEDFKKKLGMSGGARVYDRATGTFK